MNLTVIKNIITAVISAAILMPVSSCVKDHFTVSSPGADIDPPDMHATMTIAQFKQQYYIPILANTLPVLITDSVVLCGIINADDRSGNFYKEVSLQDSTGGMVLKIDASNLYYQYPAGRRIWIKTKGLYIFNYGGTLQLGGFIDLSGTHPGVGGVQSTNIANNIVTGKWGLTVPVQKMTIAQLSNVGNYINLQSMLYEIDSVEFSQQDTATGAAYANVLTKASGSIVINDCMGNSMTLYSSGYANFASVKPSSGHGNILGIYTYYAYGTGIEDFELEIRDTTDIRFTSSQRCQ